MRTIWKFWVRQTRENKIAMPEGARLLHVGVQDGMLRLWADVDPMRRSVNRNLYVAMTGEDFDSEDRMVYVGTAIGVPLVFHVYDAGETIP